MNSIPSESTTPSKAPFLALWDHFKDELLASDSESFEELKRERVINFFGIPWAIEKLMVFGFFICMDSFLYTFTILPLRILLVLYTVTIKFISNFKNEEKRFIHLNISQKSDLLKGVLIILVCISLQSVDAAQMYHSIRGQSVIKLYVIFNVLEIFDKLCCAFGGDILDSLFSKSTLGDKKSASNTNGHLWPISHFCAAYGYILFHTIILFYLAITLNVAINSYSNALLTLLLSNQFIEIKGSVFKRFEKENLFQLSCSDIVERFQLALFLTVITVRNLIELSGSPTSPFSILPTSFIPLFPAMTTLETLLTPVIIVFASELLVDWLKHAFITKFNQIRPSIYNRYIDILSKDLVDGNVQKSENQKKFADSSLMVSRRIGFAALPLACLTIRVASQTVTMISDSIQEKMDTEEPFTIVFTQPSGVWIFCGFAVFVILTFIKLLVGINILGFAHRRYASMERRETEERARAEKLDAQIAKEKENQINNEVLDDPKDNVLGKQKQVITLDNIDRYTLFKSRIP